jgi:hypothetical protein
VPSAQRHKEITLAKNAKTRKNTVMKEYHGSSFVDFFAPKIRARKDAKKSPNETNLYSHLYY